ncbi:MAG: DUF2589 domain-containing protein [Alphaproteobacteria bacterium]|nr:DUF2589 domain-containing protein [Alphaproteobacteria bacterium]MBQ6888586.1 DUF2589 domain-containing protein [Lachnospiraceae bacterium]
MEKVDFESLIVGVTQALQNTQDMLEKQALNGFLQYFDNDNGQLSAKAKDIVVQYSDKGEQKVGKINVPLATLVPHNNLIMESVEVKIHTSLTVENDKLHAEVGQGENGIWRPKKGKFKEKGNCDINIVFRNKEPMSGKKEIVTMLEKTL